MLSKNVFDALKMVGANLEEKIGTPHNKKYKKINVFWKATNNFCFFMLSWVEIVNLLIKKVRFKISLVERLQLQIYPNLCFLHLIIHQIVATS